MRKWKTVMGTLAGNIMEFYDWIIYANLSLYISKNFFPSDNHSLSLLMTFGGFASGYLTRPIGSIIFGHIGDKYGRRMALLYSIILITFSTFIIGLLPTYKEIGLFSPTLLIILRLLQGLAVSGEEGSAVVYLMEMFQMRKNAVMSSFVMASVFWGVLFGSFSTLCCNWLIAKDNMYEWGWRIPFLFSIILGLFSLKMRWLSVESPIFKSLHKNNGIESIPFVKLLQTNRLNLLKMFLLSGSFAIPSSVFCNYLPTYYSDKAEIGSQLALLVSTLGIANLCLLAPIVGLIAEKIGCRRTVNLGCMLLLIFGYPIFELWQIPNVPNLFIVEFSLSIILAFISAPMFAIIFEAFPVEVRCTGVALAFNSGMALFAGFTPLFIISASTWGYMSLFIGVYLALSGLGGIIALKSEPKMRDTVMSLDVFNILKDKQL